MKMSCNVGFFLVLFTDTLLAPMQKVGGTFYALAYLEKTFKIK